MKNVCILLVLITYTGTKFILLSSSLYLKICCKPNSSRYRFVCCHKGTARFDFLLEGQTRTLLALIFFSRVKQGHCSLWFSSRGSNSEKCC